MKKHVLAALVAGSTALAGGAASAQDQTFIAIGTGGVTGVYYPTGGAICRLVNRDRPSTASAAAWNRPAARSSTSTPSAAANWNSAWHSPTGSSMPSRHLALRGAGPVRRTARRLLGPPRALHRGCARRCRHRDFRGPAGQARERGQPRFRSARHDGSVMEAYGWTMDDFALASELQAAEQSQALCDNNIDAMIYTVGHPSGSIQEATTACDSVLVEVSGETIDALVADRPYYRTATIPGGMYRGNPEDTHDLRRRRDLRDLGRRPRGGRLHGGLARSSRTSTSSAACTRPSPISIPRRWPMTASAHRCIPALSATSARPA
jgi:outer membrane murein-binding lipoprotein Lpp